MDAKLSERVARLEVLATQIRFGVAVILICGGAVLATVVTAGKWAIRHAMVDAIHSTEVSAEIQKVAMRALEPK